MTTKVQQLFTTIRTEGALLPPDILQRVMDGDGDLGGLHPEAYHLYGERLNEATNRAWNRLQGAWQAFKQAQERLPEDDLGTTITRERWLMVLFNVLDYGRLESATAIEFDGKSYAISHRYKSVPIHLLSYKVDLDSRTKGVAGAAAGSPHSMLQVFLNRMDEHLWGILSNGYQLRLLRDNLSLTRQAYIEFDLEAMMEGEVYSDFVLLYLLCHQSRLEQEKHSDYWLENWRKAAEEQGKRALEDLRIGVERAINYLGMGFLDHSHNTALRDALSDGTLDKQDYYRELLRLVYRMLFLFVAEDRNLLHLPDASEQERAIYQHYSTNKLRDIAANLRGTRHHDLYESLRLVMRLLGGEREGANGLGLPVLGSMLFSDDAMLHLLSSKIANRDLLEAIRAISTVADHDIRRLRRVDFKNLGSEELGSVYESLLELHPDINIPARTFSLATAGGNERKTTGSYYTPTSLINALLDSALDPVLDEAINPKADNAGNVPTNLTREEMESNILNLKVVDPACGSGHFLIAAANRMAKRLASVRTGEDEPTPEHITQAKRDVIANCIYGVDLNEMAVELCKVNLWLESIDPGKPLTFLDSRIQHGNSLLGTTPALMARGIPEDAFPTKSGLIEGDQNKIVSILRKQNREEQKQRQAGVKQHSLFDIIEPPTDYTKLSRKFQQLAHAPDDTLRAVQAKEAQYRALAQDPEYVKGKFLSDLWCAVFVWHKAENAEYTPFNAPSALDFNAGVGSQTVPAPPTDLLYRNIEDNPLDDKWADIRAYTAYLADSYDFFHWHIAFPEVFNVKPDLTPDETGGEGIQAVTGWDGGFDVVLGNPPWEKLQPEEKEFFARVVPTISLIENYSKRQKAIKVLESTDPIAWRLWIDYRRVVFGVTSFLHKSTRYPLSGKGNLGTPPLFVDLSRQIMNPLSYSAVVVPSAVISNKGTSELFKDLMDTGLLHEVFDFENRQGFFPDVDSRMRFALIVLSKVNNGKAKFGFLLQNLADIKDEDRIFSLSAEQIEHVNPNSYTCPVFRSSRSASIVTDVHHSLPIIKYDTFRNFWKLETSSMFQMSHEAHKLIDDLENDLGLYPLWEGKMVAQYNHRASGIIINLENQARQAVSDNIIVEQLQNPKFSPAPRYWVSSKHLDEKLEDKWENEWLLSFCPVTSPTNERTCLVSVLPRVATGNSLFQIFSYENIPVTSALLGNLNSMVLDFILREKMGGNNLNHFIFKQLPVIPPHTYTQALLEFIVPRVLELTYTAWDLQAFAQDVGYEGAPFIWDDERRFWLRAELDALYFHLYGIGREDVDYIMETFPIVKRKDIKATADENGEGGSYRTKDAILAIYDDMANLPTMAVPAPKQPSPQTPLPNAHSSLGEGLTMITIPDVSQYQPALSPPPASPDVAHEE